MAGYDETSDADASESDPHAGQPILTAGAPALAAEAALVLLHGRGATAQGIVNLTERIHHHGVAVFAPQAARSRWYPYAPDEPLARNEPHLSSACSIVGRTLDKAGDIGISPEKTVVLGFSQGASVAAEFAATRPRRYGGIVALSGGLLGEETSAFGGSLEGTPVLLGVGADDGRVSLERIHRTAHVFRSLDADVTERVYEGVGHEVTDDELDVAGSMLEDLLDA